MKSIEYYYRYYLNGLLVGVDDVLSNDTLTEKIGFDIEALHLYDFELFECGIDMNGYYHLTDEDCFPNGAHRISIIRTPAWMPSDPFKK